MPRRRISCCRTRPRIGRSAELQDADLRRRGRRFAASGRSGTCSPTAATSGATTSTSPSRPAPRIAPSWAAYVQDEIFVDRVRFTVGGRVDKFGNLSDPVFSPRLAAVYKLTPAHALRVSFNRAFRSPSVINNYLDTHIVVPTDFSGAGAALAAAGAAAGRGAVPLDRRAVGSGIPIGATAQEELQRRVGDRVRGRVHRHVRRTHDGRRGVLRQRRRRQHQLRPAAEYAGSIHRRQPATGLAAGPTILALMAQRGIYLPRTAYTYLNLGRCARKGSNCRSITASAGPLGLCELLVAGEADGARRSAALSIAGARAAADEPVQRRLHVRRPPAARQRHRELLG